MPEYIYGLEQLRSRYQPCVATIGSFDGVHRGHQRLLQQVKDKATALKLSTMVMLFEPQPYEFFAKQQAPARIMRLRDKVEALFAEGIDRVVCIKFSEAFRQLSADQYIEEVLLNAAGVKSLVIGDDFRFGCGRTGDFSLLQQAALKYDFEVCDTQTEQEQGERISSTRIRGLLEKCEFSSAAKLLGRPFKVNGRVVYGKQLGRTIGYPTINVGLGRYRSPIEGVFAVNVSCDEIIGERRLEDVAGIANVGVRPTVGGRAKPILEVHILDHNIDLYGQRVSVEFLTRIRVEKKFESVEQLRDQIAEDEQVARCYFAQQA